MIVPTTPPTPTRDDLERVSAELAERAAVLYAAAQRTHAAHVLLRQHLERARAGTPDVHTQALRRALGMVRSLDDEGLVRISSW